MMATCKTTGRIYNVETEWNKMINAAQTAEMFLRMKDEEWRFED